MADYTAVDDPSAFFQCKLYTGNGGTQAITLDGLNDMQPDFVWLKKRSDADNHSLFNSTSGVTKTIYSNLNESEYTESTSLTAFGSNGFSLGADGVVNANTKTYAAWCWKESATAGFDIVGYTGNASNRTISHSLSAIPKMMIIKRLSGTATAWLVYHASIGATKGLNLNTTGAPDDADTYFQDTAPSSSVFTLGNTGEVNADGATYINFLFSEKQGFSKFGAYYGNGSATDETDLNAYGTAGGGTFVYTGFKPAMVMVRRYDSGDSWVFGNNKALGWNPDNNFMLMDADAAESPTDWCNFLSNGFKLARTDSSVNHSGGTFIFMAFAENPFVSSGGVPGTAR